MIRRCWFIISAITLAACLVITCVSLVTVSRLEKRRQATLQASLTQSQSAVEQSVTAVLKETQEKPSVQEINRFKALNATTNRIVARNTALISAILKPVTLPACYRWAILLTAALSAPGLICWAWPRMHRSIPESENLDKDELEDISRQVNRRILYHWQTYIGLFVALLVGFGLRFALKVIWPQYDDGVLGQLVGLVPLGYGTVIGFAIFWPLLSQDFRRELALRGFCSSCGYDLRATPERCPECGKVRSP